MQNKGRSTIMQNKGGRTRGGEAAIPFSRQPASCETLTTNIRKSEQRRFASQSAIRVWYHSGSLLELDYLIHIT